MFQPVFESPHAAEIDIAAAPSVVVSAFVAAASILVP